MIIDDLKPYIDRAIDDYGGDVYTWLDYKSNIIHTSNYAIYNTEDLKHKTQRKWHDILKKADIVFDYSLQNVMECPVNENHIFSPIKPIYNHLPSVNNKEFDILFYGYLTPRRQKLIAQLRTDFTVVVLNNTFGDDLASHIQKARIVLSVGAFNNRCNDSSRIIPAIDRGARIVAEEAQESWFNDYYKDRVHIVSYDKINEKCRELIG